MPVYPDKNAAMADAFVPVNRIKPHTCFEGPIESGMAKMAVVGFGKQLGAQALHSYGSLNMGANLIEGFDLLRATVGSWVASQRSKRRPGTSFESKL